MGFNEHGGRADGRDTRTVRRLAPIVEMVLRNFSYATAKDEVYTGLPRYQVAVLTVVLV